MVCCCVPFCKSEKGKTANVSYHEFPYDLELRNKWIKNISRENLIINDKSASTVVCSIHFHPSDFILIGKYKRLKKNSVPTIFPGYPSYKISTVTSPRRELKRKSVDAKQNSIKKYPKVENASSTETSNSDTVQILTDISNPNTIQLSNIASKEKDSQGNLSVTEKATQTVYDLPGELIKQRKEILKLKKQVWAKNKMLQKKQSEIDNLSKELQHYSTSKVYQILNNISNDKSSCAHFLLEQLLNYNNNRPAWSDETIRECILWNLSSPKCYTVMRKRNFIKLPCRMTLSRYEKSQGIASIIKERLRAECCDSDDDQ